MLFRLAYYSTNLIKKTTNPRQSELRKIILSAGTRNRERGITGGLMFNRISSVRFWKATALRFPTCFAGSQTTPDIAPS